MFLGRATRLPCTGDDAVALFAAYQFGLVSDAQARRSGLGRTAVDARLRGGAWLPTAHRGVFQVVGFGASAWCPRRAVLAAILAVASGAFACRETAAWLWRLDGAPQGRADIVHVGVPAPAWFPPTSRADSPAAGVRVHVLRVSDAELARRPPFLLTSVRRTLDDLARDTDRAAFARMLDSAVRQRLMPPAAVPSPRDAVSAIGGGDTAREGGRRNFGIRGVAGARAPPARFPKGPMGKRQLRGRAVREASRG
ncbi:hypothetical protein F4561_000648 [Lipingzhangella halophila]|uniref:Transcriptional regulator, AbiEi antitoxin, Type IV TA system n=1 Tax=Lipingzhangella halophila TaxID=1783352 RepID=A0A7W7RDU5_9ACTN|nr:hypothetical protein [Lipingzhangella halophila]MBB4929828.1 hypothetical protein [Lipingzhangella halophila]